MRFGKRVVDGNGSERRLLHFRHRLVRRHGSPDAEQVVAVGDARVRQRIARILDEGLLEVVETAPESILGSLVP